LNGSNRTEHHRKTAVISHTNETRLNFSLMYF